VGLPLVTLTIPAFGCWLAARREVIEWHIAALVFGIGVVAFDRVFYDIPVTSWLLKGREGFVEDVVDKYSASWGIGGVILGIGLGVALGELRPAETLRGEVGDSGTLRRGSASRRHPAVCR
jgi:hypothetical protein